MMMASKRGMARVPSMANPLLLAHQERITRRSVSPHIRITLQSQPGENPRDRGRTFMRNWLTAASLAVALLLAPGAAPAQKLETTKVRLAVGGKSSVYYLPLTVTERLGYFK